MWTRRLVLICSVGPNGGIRRFRFGVLHDVPFRSHCGSKMPVFVQVWAGPFGVAFEWHFALRELVFLLLGLWVWSVASSPGGSSVVVDLLGRGVRYLLDWW